MSIPESFRQHPNTLTATLVEDFITTARDLKQPYLRVKFDDLATPSDIELAPLVLVPTAYWIYPLKKDTQVTVIAQSDAQDSLTLYSVDFDLPQALLDDAKLPSSGSLVAFDAVPATLGVTYVNEAFWVITMDGASLVQQGEVLTFFKGKKVVSYTPSDGTYAILCGKFQLEAKDLLSVLASGGFNLQSSNKFAMKSNNVTLKELFVKLFEYIKDLYQRLADFETKTINVNATVSGTATVTSAPGSAPVTGSGTQTIPLSGFMGAASSKPSEVDSYKSSKSDTFFQE